MSPSLRLSLFLDYSLSAQLDSVGRKFEAVARNDVLSMIVGKPSVFAIESGITEAYESLGSRAFGFFVLHVNGIRYGVHAPDATLLANSYDEVEARLLNRGQHIVPFELEPDGSKIADAIKKSIYAPDQELKDFFGMPHPEFLDVVISSKLEWAPDGGAAFDDGSSVLQFDVSNQVRLIGFRSENYNINPETFSDVWLPADEFYNILQCWHDAFTAEWSAAPKIPE